MTYKSINQVVLSRIEMFEVLARELHFGRTAEALGVSQSSLSEQIRNLEADLGLILFERDTRNVRLTDEGARLIEPARTLLDQAQRFHNTAKAAADRSGALLRLGYPPSATTTVMNAIMPLVSSLPDLTFETHAIYAIDAGRELQLGNLDVMLMFDVDGQTYPELGWIPFLEDEVNVVVGPTHPLANHTSISVEQFTKLPLAIGGDLVGPRRPQLERRFAALGHPLDIVHASTTVNDYILHLLTGRTVGLGTELLAKLGGDAGLRTIPIVESISVKWGFAYRPPLPHHITDVVQHVIAGFVKPT